MSRPQSRNFPHITRQQGDPRSLARVREVLVDFAAAEADEEDPGRTWRKALADFDRCDLIDEDLVDTVHLEVRQRNQASMKTGTMHPEFAQIVAKGGPPTPDNDDHFSFTSKPVLTVY